LPESWAEIFGPLAISRAAREVSVPSRWGVFLMRLVRELSPRSCVELGTGFGISAAYQAASLQLNGAGGLITLDAAGEWAEIAEQGFSELGLERVEIEVGELNDTLEDAVTRAAPVDYAFVDAEHQELATHRHFETLLPHLSDGAVVAFDDIIFPEEMMRAWKAISRHARVAVAIGLGRIGVVVISGGDS
jgi:predicted O-methyltransferase YrrM